MMRVNGISGGYRRHSVLHRLSLTLPRGSITLLLGPNGSGKTTLLKMLAGLLAPAEGEITLAGRPLGTFSRRALAQQVAFMPQQRPVPALTAAGLLACARYPYCGLTRTLGDADRAAIDRAAELCNIAPFLDRPLATLSGGERQRVYFAATLAQEARVLLLDEPTACLDAAAAFELGDLLRRARDAGHTVVAAVHDLPLALALADRVAVVHGGHIAFEGTPAAAVESGVFPRVFGVEVHRHDEGYTVSPM